MQTLPDVSCVNQHDLQAYGGKNYAKMGILLQRALIVASSIFLVICCIWAFGEPLLLLAGSHIGLS